jgi:hypothetical protein
MELTCGQIVDSSKLIPKKLRIGPKFQLRELLVWEKFILNQEAFGWIGSRTKKPSGGLVHGPRSLRVDWSTDQEAFGWIGPRIKKPSGGSIQGRQG